MSPYSRQDLLKLLALTSTYVVLAKLTVLLFNTNNIVNFVWIANGVALAALCISGSRLLPAVFVGAFLGLTLIGQNADVALSVGLRHTAALFVGIWVLQRDGRFNTAVVALSDYARVFALALSIGLITGLTWWIQVRLAIPYNGPFGFLQRVAGTTLATLVFMPLVLVWRTPPRDWMTLGKGTEAALILGLSFLVGQVVFLNWLHESLGQIARGYWMYLFITWAAVRLGPHGTTLLLAVTGIQALLGAQWGLGFFSDDLAKTGLSNYFFYMLSLSAPGMALATYFTERKRVESDLLKSQLSLNVAQKVAHVGSWELDVVQNRLTWSEEMYRIFGMPPEEFGATYETFLDTIHPDDRHMVDRAYISSLEPGGRYDIEYRIIHKTYGQLHWGYARCEHVRDANGKVLRSIGTVQDITERKVLETINERERIRLATILRTASDGIHILDHDGVLVEANEAFLNMLGIDDSVIGKLRISDWSLSSATDSKARLDELTSHRGRTVFETRHRRRDGSVIDVEISASGIEIDGKGYLYAASRDITERKQAEEKARVSEERLRLAMGAANQGWFDVNLQTGEAAVSPEYARIIGYAPDDFQTDLANWLENVHPEDRDALTAAFQVCVANGGPATMEYRRKTKSGDWKWIQSIGKIVQWDAEQRATRMLGIHTDITTRKQTEVEILRSNAELEQFSYAISHDMRQPLRMISSYMQLLETAFADHLDAEKRQFFGFAIDGAKRMDAMMLGLLDYSRVGRKGEPPTWVESRAILDDALFFLQPSITEAQADVRIQGAWPRIHVSPDEILRLVQNLIGNAVKFRLTGRKPEITVASGVVGNEWRLSVADNGVGILPDQIGRLFQVFQRLQSRAAYEGTGVGLALCRKIVEHHGGKIWVESAGEGQGSLFCVALPQAKAEIR